MILAGIDEAGYGPLLGPLVVGACAFEITESPPQTPVSEVTPEDPDQSTDNLPNLWKLLRKHISKTKSPKGKKIHVNDSKLVYSTANGLKELERAILTLSTTCHGPTDSLDELLAIIAPHATPDLSTYPWYLPPTSERFPLESDAMSIKLFANALQQEMSRAGARCVHLAARVVTERPFNALCSRTNKGNALFSIASIHLDHLVRTFGHQNLTIFCDRQGGREHYGPLLRTLFDDWTHSIDSEIPSRAAYSMTRNNHTVKILFCEKAEAQCMPTAVASMISKYLREALMHRFNAFWLSHLPGIAPTAGYYTDGQRFLVDIAQKRNELNIPDAHLVRCR
jgi:hypothetical protein